MSKQIEWSYRRREGEILSEIPGRGIYVMFDAKEVMEATKRQMKRFNIL